MTNLAKHDGEFKAVVKPWIRLYRNSLHNPKIVSLSDRQHRIWHNCLLMADDDGCLPCMRDIACHLRTSQREAEELLCELVEAGLIDVQNPAGTRTFRMHDWNTHQYVSDTSTERVRKFRNKNNETQPETEMKRFSNAPREQRQITDTDKIITPLPPKGGGRTKRGSRLSESWALPDEWREWTEVRCPASSREAIEREALVFANYWQSSAGAKAVKLDWFKTWQNWCLKAFSTAPVRPQSPQNQNYFERRAASARTIIELAGGL